MEEKCNKEYARRYAEDGKHDVDDVKAAWWELFSNYRSKKWRAELKSLSEDTGISFEDVCRYIDTEPSAQPGFYKKMPKLRDTFIGVGMAYKLPLDTINRWLSKYGAKRKLYVKDVLSDLIWIYLITVNYNDRSTDTNYYSLYDSCRKAVVEIYNDVWNDLRSDDVDTVILQSGMEHVGYDKDFTGLRSFIVENIDAFKTAYVKPRRLLHLYVTRILEIKNLHDDRQRKWTMSSLRGYLDDSMINYLSGSPETINVMDSAYGSITSSIKYIPKTKKAHISMCLALGMTQPVLDDYLEMMGYSPLDGVDQDEGALINMLNQWDRAHPLQAKLKKVYRNGSPEEMHPKDQLTAVQEMLELRADLKTMYEETYRKLIGEGASGRKFRKFPYMND